MMRILLLALILIFVECTKTNLTNNDSFFLDFERGYKELQIPRLSISYLDNFRAIRDKRAILKQTNFFKKMKRRLSGIDQETLSASRKIDFDLIKYELDINLLRLELEKDYVENKPSKISSDGILKVPNGKKWYRYYLKRWVDSSVTPDEIFEFGILETKKIKGKISQIQKRSGMSTEEFEKHLVKKDFFYNDLNEVQKAFEQAKRKIAKNLTGKFPDLEKIPDLRIKRGTDQELNQVPGFYRNQTFYFNYFDKPFNRRQVEWIYLHEGIPGHHYQAMLMKQMNRSEIVKLFNYSGFAEGWAAYVEDIGIEFGAYPDMYSELGKWEWDLIRSVRVSIDVGLNFYGWSDERALEFWKKHIDGQDEIGVREIKRMKRWTAQVVTYKYGSKWFLDMREKIRKEKEKDFDLKEFHRAVLGNGALPFSVLEKHL